MDERLLPGSSILGGDGLPAGLAWPTAWRGRRRAALIGAGGGFALLLVVALLVGAIAEDDARAVPFANTRAALVAAATAAMRDMVPRALSPEAAQPFPYHVVEQLALGEASYYARTLEGRRTASGETYRGTGLTAAHRTLPFGSLLRVTNVRNGRSVIVRVNDRGPFHRQRVLDLSEAAARELGLFRRGRGKVKVELVSLLDAAAAR